METNPFHSLRYWAVTHKRVLKLADAMPGRFLFINFDKFCSEPDAGVQELCEFIAVTDPAVQQHLVGLVTPPRSMGRWKLHGGEIFDAGDIDYVESLGFETG